MYHLRPNYDVILDNPTTVGMYAYPKLDQNQNLADDAGQPAVKMQKSVCSSSNNNVGTCDLSNIASKQKCLLEKLELLGTRLERLMKNVPSSKVGDQTKGEKKCCSIQPVNKSSSTGKPQNALAVAKLAGLTPLNGEAQKRFPINIVACATGTPPLSLFVLMSIIREQEKSSVLLRTYVHSSVAACTEKYRKMLPSDLNDSCSLSRSSHVINVIWKNNTPLSIPFLSNGGKCRIFGEIALAKYLANLIGLYPGKCQLQCDQWMDAAAQFTTRTGKDRDNILKDMNDHLGNHSFFCDSCIGLADIVLWSALRQDAKLKPSAYPPNIKTWFAAVSSMPYFQSGSLK